MRHHNDAKKGLSGRGHELQIRQPQMMTANKAAFYMIVIIVTTVLAGLCELVALTVKIERASEIDQRT
jgi:hypothetical protein